MFWATLRGFVVLALSMAAIALLEVVDWVDRELPP
jgi:hypothetical protein